MERSVEEVGGDIVVTYGKLRLSIPASEASEIASAILDIVHGPEIDADYATACREEVAHIKRLRPLVKPPFNEPYDGSLYGIRFRYDEDRDDRVLIAIEKLKPYAVAIDYVRESEGCLGIFLKRRGVGGRIITDLVNRTEMAIYSDTWCVNVYES